MRLKHTLLALGALLALATPAAAQRAGGMAACRTDIATFCQNVEAGGGKKMRCLIENQAKLSPDCGAAVQARADKRADRKADAGAAAAVPAQAAGAPNAERPRKRFAACRADMTALCGDVQKGGGARIRCLRDNTAKLSPDCASVLASMPARRRDAGVPQAPSAAAPATGAPSTSAPMTTVPATPAPSAVPPATPPKQ
jgi:Cysteine rich repeat